MKNTHNLKMRTNYVIILLLLMSLSSEAQITNQQGRHPEDPQDIICHQSYKVVEKRTYEIEDEMYSSMTPSEQYGIRDLIKEFNEDFQLSSNGKLTFRIKHGKSVNYYEDWMNKPITTILTEEGTRIIRSKQNSYGERESFIPHNVEYKELMETMANNIATGKNKLIDEPIITQKMMQEGWTMMEDGSFHVQLHKDGGQMYYLPNSYLLKYVPETASDCNKMILQLYKPVLGLKNKLALYLERTKEPYLAYDSYQITRVEERIFSDWNIKYCNDDQMDLRENFANKIQYKLYPNPVENLLYIEIPALLKDPTIQIFDQNGKSWHVSQEKINKGHYSLNTSGLSNRIYFVKIIANDETTILKFIKN